MIQRIQSIYLFFATVAMSFMFFMPLGRFIAGTEEYSLRILGLYESTSEPRQLIAPAIYLISIAVVATIIPLFNIFQYKKRLLQIRLNYIAGVLIIGTLLLEAFYLYEAHSSIAEFDIKAISLSVANIMPIVSLILLWLANRAIVKDEALVRSLDRIR